MVASDSIAALTPAELTPIHVLLVVWTDRLMRRHGFADDALVRMMVGVLLPRPQGSAGHVISA